MGVTHSLHLIDPAKFSNVVAELASHPFESVGDVESYLDRYSIAADERQPFITTFTDLFSENEANWSNAAYSELLVKNVTEAEWYLDKALNYHGLYKPLRTFPALKPIQFLVTFDGWDTEPPEELLCDSGLYGLWSASFLTTAVPTIEQFANIKDAQEYAKSVEWSLIDRILRRPTRARDAVAAWVDYWDYWNEIRPAILETVNRGWALGYVMCP